jgi:quinol monooxygenase YgiN
VVIVGGTFEVEPQLREQFLVEHHSMMLISRAEKGCLEYTFAADPLQESRVVLFELWENQEDLDAHWAAMRGRPRSEAATVPTKESSIVVYEVSGQRPL